MKRSWSDRKNVLCIRLDNMGDLVMSSPAIKAVKESFGSKVTVLTSSAAAPIARYIPGIDEVIVSDVPWVKSMSNDGISGFYDLLERIRRKKFDAAIIFTVFSQNPMPAIMIAYLAGIPYRLAYCRENPYELLTDWVPDKEPFTNIIHQVERDLNLVAAVGAFAKQDDLNLNIPNSSYSAIKQKLQNASVQLHHNWMIVHPGVSESKRQYPEERFKALISKLVNDLGLYLVFTGVKSEQPLVERLRYEVRHQSMSLAGQLALDDFMALIDIAPMVLSVNTSTVHIASALKTPVIVLYAMTNPQHTPWKTLSRVFPFPVEQSLKSKNEILRYVADHISDSCGYPQTEEIIDAVKTMMKTADQPHSSHTQNPDTGSNRS